jgi:hypothetical protein
VILFNCPKCNHDSEIDSGNLAWNENTLVRCNSCAETFKLKGNEIKIISCYELKKGDIIVDGCWRILIYHIGYNLKNMKSIIYGCSIANKDILFKKYFKQMGNVRILKKD